MRSVEEIDFGTLSPTRFEELCYDLLEELGFQNLRWRQGGGDSGRDIQGTKRVVTALVNPFDELWFFECKRYHSGVAPAQLNSKIAWADAEKPKHLVFFVSSYITNSARDWLQKISAGKFYQTHLIEGQQIKKLVTDSNLIISKYFSTELQRLLLSSYVAWVEQSIIPDLHRLKELQPQDQEWFYSTSELAFLWNCIHSRRREIEDAPGYNGDQSIDHLFIKLIGSVNCSVPILSCLYIKSCIASSTHTSSWDYWAKTYCAELQLKAINGEEQRALYTFVRDSDGEGVEVVTTSNSNSPFLIRHVVSGASQAMNEARQIVEGKNS